MKRFSVNLIATFLAFAAGLVTASSWHPKRTAVIVDPVAAKVFERCPPSQIQPSAPPVSSVNGNAPAEFVFAQGRLKLVPEHVQLNSESLRYDIDLSYPQIVGADDPAIRKINQDIKDVATRKYQWPLNPPAAELANIQKNYPVASNTVNFTYEIALATDSFLSFYFVGYNYSVGSARSIQETATLNYDLTSGKRLRLSDIFKRGSNYLEFISRYSIDELSSEPNGDSLSKKALAPAAENFENWHITANGIVFNFDGCKIFDCAFGDQIVDIPFSDLKPLLNQGIPGRFKITYPY